MVAVWDGGRTGRGTEVAEGPQKLLRVTNVFVFLTMVVVSSVYLLNLCDLLCQL